MGKSAGALSRFYFQVRQWRQCWQLSHTARHALCFRKIRGPFTVGTVIKNRAPTGEVIAVDAPNRDAIISRVIWLRGMERQNSTAHDRCIYIHGTPEERHIGKPFSFGCIRMRSRDVIALYDSVHIGMHVTISEKPIDELLPRQKPTLLSRAD